MSFLRYPFEELPFVFLALVLALTVHEFAHAYSAYKFGDPTAKNEGRVSLNPRRHLDILGTIFIFIAGFGWAKPVPVDRRRFKNPRLMSIVVSLLGPVSNLVMAFIGMLIVYLIYYFNVDNSMSYGVLKAFGHFFKYFILLNLTLCVFNLIPLPPLDGYRVIEDLAPVPLRIKLMQNEQWGVFVFLLIVFVPPLNNHILTPILNIGGHMFMGLDEWLYGIFKTSPEWVKLFT